MQQLKIVVLGDGAVGKTCLLIAHCTGRYPTDYIPTAFDNYMDTITVDGVPYTLGYWDTAGGEDYDRLRPLSYPQTDIFLLAFSIDCRNSFENIRHKWVPEVQHFCPETPFLIVGCKSDLRLLESERSRSLVSYKEASDMAASMGMKYVETSALKHIGLHECFVTATRLGVTKLSVEKKKKRLFSFGSKKNKEPLLPVMPCAPELPVVEVGVSRFAEDWHQTLHNSRFYDLTFLLEGNHRLSAHKIVVCSASSFFAELLLTGEIAETEHQQQRQHKRQHKRSVMDSDRDQQEGGEGQGKVVEAVYEEEDEASPDAPCLSSTTVVLSHEVKAASFLRVLEFLYTGSPRFPEDFCEADVEDVHRVAGLLQLPHLQAMCGNIQDGESVLNHSITSFLNDQTGTAMKTLFLNQSHCADVIFSVQGCSVYAHRVVLSTRSEVMAAMFSGHFSEGVDQTKAKVDIPDTALDTFLALLEYLYTDHAPIEDGDSVGILVVGEKYCLPRLVSLCQFYIAREVERQYKEPAESVDVDVVGLLNTAEMHNAEQLVQWCLDFIAVNFTKFEQSREFVNLTDDHRYYVTKNRWPPLSALQTAEKNTTKKGSKCAVM